MNDSEVPSIFVSHASEDKNSLVRPLARKLKELGLNVWYDEFSLNPGDSLRRSIDSGLAKCAVGIVILSPNFFAKEWPQRELDALYSSEIAKRARIIPIWHEIDHHGMVALSPLLADRVAIKSSIGIAKIAAKIISLVPDTQKLGATYLAELLERAVSHGTYSAEARAVGVYHRFLAINAYKEEFATIFDKRTAKLNLHMALPAKLAAELDELKRTLSKKHQIPIGVYLIEDEPIRKSELSWRRDFFVGWSGGTLEKQESRTLAYELDLAEMDEFFVLLNVPNYLISREHRVLLETAILELGSGYKSDYASVGRICRALRALDSE